MPTHVSWIFAVTTDPTDRQAASPHSGGWTEGHWLPDATQISLVIQGEVAEARSSFLPRQVDIIGWRVSNFTISGNKLLPKGTSAVKKRFPGASNWTVDVPQASLSFSSAIAGKTNGTRFVSRGISDEMVVRGEYQPTAAYSRAVQSYIDRLLGVPFPGEGGGPVYGAIVRDLTQESFRVLSINDPTIVLDQPVGLAVNDYIRLRRVKGTNHLPISGSFRITAINGGVLTVANLPALSLARESGFARKDVMVFGSYGAINPDRVEVKKIGGPLQRYRGRRSKRRV